MSLILLLTGAIYVATMLSYVTVVLFLVRSPPQTVIVVVRQCGTCVTAASDVSAARRQNQMQGQPNNEDHAKNVDAENWETPVQETQPVWTKPRLNDEPANEESDLCTPVQETTI